ncbi:hypothetical protein HLB42_09475 [Deinococcus sp. D7000]|uniref:hypothetical protein n=1 Tax=Deinococcus radiopugnans TaxID=57497 RepID=UPI0009DFFD3A|nr:hypothetical protein [Deinococcus radiopugnans]QLG10974.1 hypothetical protein HLB42_09475 [Deinococcus sp. D7000]
MRAVQERCGVDLNEQGKPVSLHWRNRTYRVTREHDAYRAGGRWWLGEPSRDCWVLECGALTVEVHRFDETDPPQEISGWWVARVQD